MPARPSLFVVGAPKCGTTAITRYLEAHPDLFMAGRKDLHPFGADLEFRLPNGAPRPRLTEAELLRHFEAAPAGALCAESSVWTLASTEAAAEIAAFAPGGKAVVMLRHPVDAMHALWTQLRLNGLGDEDQTDFAAALALEPERAAGRRLPKGTPLPLALRYRHVVRFAEQLRRLREALGANNVHVIIQEEMRGQTEATVAALYAFAGLRPIPTPELGEVNTHKEVRSEGLRRLLRWLPAGIKGLLPANARAEARRALRRLNSAHRPRAGMEPALRAQLDLELRPEIEAVELLLGRPIPAWRRPAP